MVQKKKEKGHLDAQVSEMVSADFLFYNERGIEAALPVVWNRVFCLPRDARENEQDVSYHNQHPSLRAWFIQDNHRSQRFSMDFM